MASVAFDTSTTSIFLTCAVCQEWVACRNGKPGPMFGWLEYSLVDLQRASLSGCNICTIIYRGICFNVPIRQSDSGPWLVRIRSRSGTNTPLDVILSKHPEMTQEDIRLEFFIDQGLPKTSWSILFGHSKEIPVYSGHNVTTTRIKEWIHTCSKYHQSCKGPESAPLPTRILQLRPGRTDTVALVESRGRIAPYVALSHCWGSEQVITTTKDSIQQRMTGISMDLLSNTFRDAVSLCQLLGIEYLWIDSLCIIQDDLLDWQIESSKMASVYGNALLTIAATCSADGKGGCFTQRSVTHKIRPGDPAPDDLVILSRSKIQHVPWDGDLIENLDRVEEFPLLSRCWCFQEQLLGRRVLHFAKEELVWDCCSGFSCECGYLKENQSVKKDFHRSISHADGLFVPIDHLNPVVEDIPDLWRKLIHEYTFKRLTRQSDILPAVSGIAKKLGRDTLGTYLAGLWKNSLLVDMMWFALPDASLRLGAWNHRADEYIAPTWSWASLVGPVAYNFEVTAAEINALAEVIDADCSHRDRDEYGRVRDGRLLLKASSISAELGLGRRQLTLSRNGVTTPAYIDTEQDFQKHLNKTVTCVSILAYERRKKSSSDGHCIEVLGLVVEPAEGGRNRHKRIGMIPQSPEKFWVGGIAHEIEII